MSNWIQLRTEGMNYQLLSDSDIHFTLLQFHKIQGCSVLSQQ